MSRRSIFSRRQSLAPGSYDNPLADFLDALPDYFNQYSTMTSAKKSLQQQQIPLQNKEFVKILNYKSITNTETKSC